jgi:hypothetical protein
MTITEPSKSTDKLNILISGLQYIPPEKLEKLKKFNLKWSYLPESDEIGCDNMIVPELEMVFE